jgi:hypothetical protein
MDYANECQPTTTLPMLGRSLKKIAASRRQQQMMAMDDTKQALRVQ